MKFSELDPTIPDLTFFQAIYESVFYKVNDLRLYEVICLKILNYKLNFITPFMLIQHSVVNGILFTNDFNLYNNKEFDAQEIGLLSKAYTFIYEIIDFTVESKILSRSLKMIFSSKLLVSNTEISEDIRGIRSSCMRLRRLSSKNWRRKLLWVEIS